MRVVIMVTSNTRQRDSNTKGWQCLAAAMLLTTAPAASSIIMTPRQWSYDYEKNVWQSTINLQCETGWLAAIPSSSGTHDNKSTSSNHDNIATTMKIIKSNNQPGCVRDGNNGNIKSNAKGWQLPGTALGPTDDNRPVITRDQAAAQPHRLDGNMLCCPKHNCCWIINVLCKATINHQDSNSKQNNHMPIITGLIMQYREFNYICKLIQQNEFNFIFT